ncbi:hypothetical protein WJX73_000469 [Symbiochloris irregularis]|uniref:Major facilitator superfamily (MFS) profile domain-containing protein n=1 Tax=Symbiochloris irregularis TaxID=706552 RepID=A0AAW1PI01_9CHLO
MDTPTKANGSDLTGHTVDANESDSLKQVGYPSAAPPGSTPSESPEAKFTIYVFATTLVAAGAGLLFGFDNGIIGGVTGTSEFQRKFLPDVYRVNFLEGGDVGNYCKFDSQILQLFVSVLYLAAAVIAPLAGVIANWRGRQICLLTSGCLFGIGIILLATAQNVAMVVLGRILMGGGVGFANSSSTLYIVEVAPPRLRGGLGIMFQLVQTLGILIAYVYNYAFDTIDWGWRLSIALGGVFAALVVIGALVLPDTPISLLNRGRPEDARRVLERVRGTANVDAEFQEMTEIVTASKKVPNSFKSLLFNPRYRPQLAVVIAMPIFQQWTGINAVIFYTPQIFSYVSHSKGLEDTVVVGAVNVAATLVSTFTVDRFGRKFLFTEGGLQMAVCMIIIAATLGTEYGMHPNGRLPEPVSRGLLAVFCTFAAGYAWSFGPLPWLLPSEVQPLETRAAAASVNTTLNMLMTFVVAQTFQDQLCAERWGVFAFFAGLELLFVVLILFFLPETKGKSMDQIAVSFGDHWFWGKLKGVRTFKEERYEAAKNAPAGAKQTTIVAH